MATRKPFVGLAGKDDSCKVLTQHYYMYVTEPSEVEVVSVSGASVVLETSTICRSAGTMICSDCSLPTETGPVDGALRRAGLAEHILLK